MIKYIRYYYLWSRKAFLNESEATGANRATKENRMGTIFFGILICSFQYVFGFVPFQF